MQRERCGDSGALLFELQLQHTFKARRKNARLRWQRRRCCGRRGALPAAVFAVPRARFDAAAQSERWCVEEIALRPDLDCSIRLK